MPSAPLEEPFSSPC